MEVGRANPHSSTSTFWRGRRVLVTGATGIIGSWLVKDLLTAGCEVVALIRDLDTQSELYRSGDIERVKVVQGSLEDFWSLERAINEGQVDSIFHLAAQTIVGAAFRSPYSTFESNIRGTYNLLEACRLHRDLVKRIVVASSDKAYGEQPTLPYTEDMSLNGRYPYEVSKSCADMIAQSYFHAYRLPVAISRCGNVYGGGDLNWSRIVPSTIRSLLQGERPIIRSDGTFVRDYIYVKDVVSAYMQLAEHLDDAQVPGEAFNFSTESPISVLTLVGTVQRLMGCEHLEPEVMNHVEGEIRTQDLSAAKAHDVLAWKPAYSLDNGLLETVDWYRKFLSN
jgi:CDP-glucose 4,6-dehydratase